jgi:hypothetical protein
MMRKAKTKYVSKNEEIKLSVHFCLLSGYKKPPPESKNALFKALND